MLSNVMTPARTDCASEAVRRTLSQAPRQRGRGKAQHTPSPYRCRVVETRSAASASAAPTAPQHSIPIQSGLVRSVASRAPHAAQGRSCHRSCPSCVAAHDAVVNVPSAGGRDTPAHARIGARHAGARGDAIDRSIGDKAGGACRGRELHRNRQDRQVRRQRKTFRRSPVGSTSRRRGCCDLGPSSRRTATHHLPMFSLACRLRCAHTRHRPSLRPRVTDDGSGVPLSGLVP